MGGGSVGSRAALANRRLTPEPMSSSPGTARSPPSISSLTSCRDLDAAAATSITLPHHRNGMISRHFATPAGLMVPPGCERASLRSLTYSASEMAERRLLYLDI